MPDEAPDALAAAIENGDRAATLTIGRAFVRSAEAAEPTPALVLNALADHYYQSGRADWAERLAGWAMEHDPASLAFANTRGNALVALGRTDEALALFLSLWAREPGNPLVILNLGLAQLAAGDHAAAIGTLGRAILNDAAPARAWLGLAAALREAKRVDEALMVLGEAARRWPTDAVPWINAGMALRDAGRIDHAREAFAEATRRDPGNAKAWSNLGVLLGAAGDHARAVTCLERAIALEPTLAQAHIGLAELDRPPPAEAVRRRAGILDAFPDLPLLRSETLMLMHYLAEVTPPALAEAHAAFGRVHEPAAAARAKPHAAHDFSPDRAARIGFVSGDFKRHAMAHLCWPILPHAERHGFAVTAYSTTIGPDDETARLRAKVARWRDVAMADDRALARLVRDDGIDVLIDMSGHTPRHRLLAFAERPAPLQLGWGDYVNTRGMAAFDALIADPIHVPPVDEPLYVELVVRMPRDYVCFAPAADAPPVAPPPILVNGYPTFGSFNETTKIQSATLELWAGPLRALPTSRLVINNFLLRQSDVADRVTRELDRLGIARDRVDLLTGGDHVAFLEAYARIDVMLDTHPYSGGLTTCEALWQGVPVVTLIGDRFAGRHSACHLTTAGRTHWVAASPDQFTATATALVADPVALAVTRAELRESLATSPLCDVTGFADDFFALIRRLWRERCARA